MTTEKRIIHVRVDGVGLLAPTDEEIASCPQTRQMMEDLQSAVLMLFYGALLTDLAEVRVSFV